MKKNLSAIFLFVFCALFITLAQAEPLSSWNDGAAKQRILEFVKKTTTQGNKDYIEPADRIAVFDNDGTLWVEQPMYTQLAFAFDRVRSLAPKHPDWNQTQPFKAVLDKDYKTVGSFGMQGIEEILAATHAGVTTAQFEEIVKDWIKTAKHPKFNMVYTSLIYQPMLEVMQYLRENGYKVFICSGGGVEFMRPWTEKTYGVPPEQVVGSSIKVAYQIKDNKPSLERLPEVFFINDGPGKPAGINLHIGKRPVIAFGNSDGDLQMLQWTTLGNNKPSLAMLVHHDDAQREYAYDKDSRFGKLDKALQAAPQYNWTVISMKNDWKNIFPAANP